MDAGDLRSEIIESQKFKVDLLKWKLILAAGLGAAGLGLGDRKQGMPLLLALVPLVCAYVDVVCYHNDLRIMVIARFLREEPQVDALARAYERFCASRRAVFALENFAMYWATFALSSLVGVARWVTPIEDGGDSSWLRAGAPLVVAGSVGLMASAGIRFYSRNAVEALQDGTAERRTAWRSGFLMLATCAVAVVVGIWLCAPVTSLGGANRGAGAFLGISGVAAAAFTVHGMRASRSAGASRHERPSAAPAA